MIRGCGWQEGGEPQVGDEVRGRGRGRKWVLIDETATGIRI